MGNVNIPVSEKYSLTIEEAAAYFLFESMFRKVPCGETGSPASVGKEEDNEQD